MWKNGKFTGVFFLLAIMLPVSVWAANFSDVDEFNPSFVSINFLNEKNILQGYADGAFRPDQEVNRAEALKIIYSSFGQNASFDGLDLGQLFPDVKADDWFAQYVAWAKSSGLVNGNADGTFAPARTVSRAEFMKIMLEAVGFKKELWADQQIFSDVSKDAWFAPYLNYAGKSGLLRVGADQRIFPEKLLSRAEVADVVYLMNIMVNSKDVQLLMSQAQVQMNQIDKYVTANDLMAAKRSAELAVNFTQQAIKVVPEDMQVLAKAKIAKAYSYLVDAFIRALERNYGLATDLVQQTITKADEAIVLDSSVTDEANHLKERAIEIQGQIS